MARTRPVLDSPGRPLIASGVVLAVLLIIAVMTMVLQRDPTLTPGRRILGIVLSTVQAVGFMWLQTRMVRHGKGSRNMRATLGRVGFWATWGLVAVGVANLWLTNSWTLFGASVATPLLLLPGVWSVVATLVTLIVGFSDLVVTHTSPLTSAAVVLVTIAVSVNLYAFTKLSTALVELRSSQEEIARLRVDAERHRISRDLHDIIGRTLVATSMRQQAALHLVDRDPQRAKEQLDAAHDAITEGQHQLRSIIQAEMSTSLPDEISDATFLCDRLHIDFRMDDRGRPHKPFDSAAAAALREGITNMLKHSAAGYCHVAISPDLLTAITSPLHHTGHRNRPSPVPDRGARWVGDDVAALAGHLPAPLLLPDPGGVHDHTRDRRRTMTTRILLAEDIKLVAEAFEALLSVEPEFEVVARVARGDDLVTSATRLFPDVILADIDMPGMTGIEATRMLRDKGYRGRIILLTALPGSGHLHAAMAAGADGYLLKSITAPSLINAIRAVCNGQSAIDPNVAAVAMRKGPSPLNDRETEILRLVADGSSTAQIASRLYLSKGTVRNYLSTAMSKLDADSRTAAVTRAREEGWL